MIADSNTGLQIVNVADASQPNIVGNASIGGDAFVADYARSFTAVDLTYRLQFIS